jgi:hypothetical protein
MESSDLKDEHPDDEQLEAWYRAHATTALLRDDGFSQRVLAALPPPAQHRATKRRLFCLGGALSGTLVAWFGQTTATTLPSGFPARESELISALPQLANPTLGLALGVAALSLWFVFRPKLRLLPR